jgi:hypothetical protein
MPTSQKLQQKKKYKKIEESKEWSSFIKENNPLNTNVEVLIEFDEVREVVGGKLRRKLL